MLILALDPGREKFGYAIFEDRKVEEKGILSLSQISLLWEKCRKVEKIVLGKGTGWKLLYGILKDQGFGTKIVLVEEKGSTLEARRRFFQEGAGKGIIWLIRKWLNLPGCPVDDISAQIIGEKFFEK